MPNTTIVLNEIFVDLGTKSAKSNVGRWEIQVEEPKRDKFFSKFSLDIQKKVILYLDELKTEDFKIDDKGKLLSISLKDEEWGYGEKKRDCFGFTAHILSYYRKSISHFRLSAQTV